MAKMKDYIDKEHAVGVLECLERHMSSISERLNILGIPAEKDGKPLTVFDRVCFVCDVMSNLYSPATLEGEFMFWQPSDDVYHDPEEIIAAIHNGGDTKEVPEAGTCFVCKKTLIECDALAKENGFDECEWLASK